MKTLLNNDCLAEMRKMADNSIDILFTDPPYALGSEVIIRKLQFKTRKYLTSGGKEYVSDGTVGNHSPFAKKFIEALVSRGGNDGMLTLSELNTYVEKLQTAPQFGRFGSDQQGSDFIFVVK